MYRLTRNCRSILMLFMVVVFPFNSLLADELIVAVASNFTVVMRDLAKDFEASGKNNHITLVFASSGKLYSQIKHGAPFDVFLSADQDKPILLEQSGLGISSSRFTYAQGSLVLWSANPELLDGTDSIFKTSLFNKIALANSKLAPYGVAAEQVMSKLGIENRLKEKWVQGESIAQTYQFIESGNAELGFVAKSQVWNRDSLIRGSMWLIPEEYYSAIKQDAVILSRTKNLNLAKKFMTFLKSEPVRQKIENYGYQHFKLNESAESIKL